MKRYRYRKINYIKIEFERVYINLLIIIQYEKQDRQDGCCFMHGFENDNKNDDTIK